MNKNIARLRLAYQSLNARLDVFLCRLGIQQCLYILGRKTEVPRQCRFQILDIVHAPSQIRSRYLILVNPNQKCLRTHMSSLSLPSFAIHHAF